MMPAQPIDACRKAASVCSLALPFSSKGFEPACSGRLYHDLRGALAAASDTNRVKGLL
jgi:hypothetical protein